MRQIHSGFVGFHAPVARAKVELWSADGKTNTDIVDGQDWTEARHPSGTVVSLSTAWQTCTMSCGLVPPRSTKDEQVVALQAAGSFSSTRERFAVARLAE